jgi:GH24 family phage-related lysozyme (muramidase)
MTAVSLAFNLGPLGFARSGIPDLINSLKFDEAANRIENYGTNVPGAGGINEYRRREAAKFREGIAKLNQTKQ